MEFCPFSSVFMIVLAVTSCHQNLGPTSWHLCDLISNTLSLSMEFGPAVYLDSKQLLYCLFWQRSHQAETLVGDVPAVLRVQSARHLLTWVVVREHGVVRVAEKKTSTSMIQSSNKGGFVEICLATCFTFPMFTSYYVTVFGLKIEASGILVSKSAYSWWNLKEMKHVCLCHQMID